MGIFAHQQHEQESLELRKGDYKQFEVFPIALNQGFAAGGGERGLFEKEGNCLILLARYMNNDKTVFVSDVTGRVYIKFNHPDNPWLPFSLIAGSLDFSSPRMRFTRFGFTFRLPVVARVFILPLAKALCCLALERAKAQAAAAMALLPIPQPDHRQAAAVADRQARAVEADLVAVDSAAICRKGRAA